MTVSKLSIYRRAVFVLSTVIIIESALLVSFWPKKPPKAPALKPAPKPQAAVRGKIAIVIDDWGYRTTNLPILKEIKYPLTCAVLPNLAYSKTISAELVRLGYQVILHLPMEPHEKFRLEENTVMTTMDEATIGSILRHDLDGLFGVAGVSNHMGSRATEDVRTMGAVCKELKKRGIFFLDSFVTSDSLGWYVAGKMHVRYAKRDIFLDNKDEPEYIKGQIGKLKLKAALNGHAIGIGHDLKTTLETLREEMPKLAKEGYEFVFVSDLVR